MSQGGTTRDRRRLPARVLALGVAVALPWAAVLAVLLAGGMRWASTATVIGVLGAAVHAILALVLARHLARAEARHHALAEQHDRDLAVLAETSDAALIVADGLITSQSSATSRVLGYAPDALGGRAFLDLVHPDDRPRVLDLLDDLRTTSEAPTRVECRLRTADGGHLRVATTCRDRRDDPAVAGTIVTVRDVSERDQLQQQLTHRAFHDDLTGLANRALLVDRLAHTGERSRRTGGRYAVLYVDLDGFKPLNDTYGHAFGDSVLVEVAHRLTLATRSADTVARLGGDEFAVLVEEQHGPVDAARVATRILEQLRRPLRRGGAELHLTASIGIAYDDQTAPGEVLRNADIAMYLAKREGKDRFEVFAPEMHLAVVERLHLESDLQRALDLGELTVHYQPIVTLSEQRTVGVEALVRWNHPERGLVAPGTFIPLAEETGQIAGIGRFVLFASCRQLARWRSELPGAEDLVVSVNVSARQFAIGDLVGDVARALEDSGLPAAALTLELTESALVHDAERTLRTLQELKQLGVRLAIDDFGTGYSSLAYLHRFPVDVLKIDRSFVTSVVSGRQSPALARAIVDLGRSLDLVTIAEGIEHAAELTQFRELDCALGQGFLFARPADADTTGQALAAASTVEIDVHATAAPAGQQPGSPPAGKR